MQVQCPCCQKTLSAPSEMLGKQVECPYCSVRFQVHSSTDGASVSVSTAPLAQTTATPTPPPTAAPPATAPPTASPPIPKPPGSSPAAPAAQAPLSPLGAPAKFKPISDAQDVATNSADTVPMVANPLASPPKAVASPPKAVSPKQRKSTPSPSKPVQPPKVPRSSKTAKETASNSILPPPAKSTPRKHARQATFVAADATQSRVHLGADGQLPQLVLEKGPSVEEKEEKTKTSNPLAMYGILLLSLGLSIPMLLMDFTPDSGEAPSKAQTRRLLERSYIAQEPPLEEYQLLLRQALQAYTRGDTLRERRFYRRVLDMLHAEGKNKFKGLTGVPDADQPPNDRDLEELLSTMLAEDH